MSEPTKLDANEVYYKSIINPAFAEKVTVEVKRINQDKKGNETVGVKTATILQCNELDAAELLAFEFGAADMYCLPTKNVFSGYDFAVTKAIEKGYALYAHILSCSKADWLAQGLSLRIWEIVHKAFAKK